MMHLALAQHSVYLLCRVQPASLFLLVLIQGLLAHAHEPKGLVDVALQVAVYCRQHQASMASTASRVNRSFMYPGKVCGHATEQADQLGNTTIVLANSSC